MPGPRQEEQEEQAQRPHCLRGSSGQCSSGRLILLPRPGTSSALPAWVSFNALLVLAVNVQYLPGVGLTTPGNMLQDIWREATHRTRWKGCLCVCVCACLFPSEWDPALLPVSLLQHNTAERAWALASKFKLQLTVRPWVNGCTLWASTSPIVKSMDFWHQTAWIRNPTPTFSSLTLNKLFTNLSQFLHL